MNKTLKIDFVSDVSCPWCAVGLGALEQALRELRGEWQQGEVQATLRFQPFELNPQMGPEGEDVGEHLGRKYGSTAEQQAQMREVIRQRGAEVGFEFHPEGRGRVWNTFDAHRLLHWAGETYLPQQRDLKMALLQACHRDRAAMASHEVLVQAAEQAGLPADEAREVLSSGRFAEEVREAEAFYQGAGIHAVPAVVINDRHLISGGQPAEVFARALRQLAQESAEA